MSRISKEVAEQIARKLTEKNKFTADVLHKAYELLVFQLYMAQTPEQVISTYAKYPDWFSTNLFVKFSGHGFRYESVRVPESVICNNGTDASLQLDDKIAHRLTVAKNKWQKAEEEWKQLKREVENALLALKTHSQIRQHLPAAAPYLPPPLSNALVVNFDALNKKLGVPASDNLFVNKSDK